MQRWNKWWSSLKQVTQAQVDASLVQCPDPELADKMIKRVIQAEEKHDSIGGSVTCVIRSCPTGLGELIRFQK